MSRFEVNEEGFFGRYGGMFVPDELRPCIVALRECYRELIDSEAFQKEYREMLRDYVGRPSPLYLSKALSRVHGCKIYLKREEIGRASCRERV